MGVDVTFRNWLIAQPGGCSALRELIRCIDADPATRAFGDALSQWQLHFAARAASVEVREALRLAWWRYIESRAALAGTSPAAERVAEVLDSGWLQLAAPALGWIPPLPHPSEGRPALASRASRWPAGRSS